MLYKFKKSARVINVLLMLSIAAQPAYAASVIIADTPMAAQNTAKSNIMFTMDTSGGMDVEVLLPTYNSMYYESNVTPGNNPTNLNGNFFLFPTWYRTSNTVKLTKKNKQKGKGGAAAIDLMLEGDLNSPDPLNWRARNNHYNHQYYDPFTTYQPWNGVDQNGVTFGNANPTNVEYDPYANVLGAVDITQEISSGAIVLDPNGNAFTVPNAHSYVGGSHTYPSTWYPATYYTWADLNNNGILEAGEETRYEIKNSAGLGACIKTKATAIIPGCGGAPATYPSGRTYTAELQNFANWFKYYRTVMLTLQGSIGKQLDTLASTQVGMTSLEPQFVPAPVADISSPAVLEVLRGQIYELSPNLGDWRQPIHDRMSQVYDYFKQTASVNGNPAPIQYSCQQNFNVLVTAGYLNENGNGAAGFKNYFTGQTPSLNGKVGDYDSKANGNPVSGAGTAPYADDVLNGNSFADTLADWALYIYDQNLRPDLKTGNVQLVAGTHETNPNPHLDTYVIAPGATPTLANAPSTINPATTNLWTMVTSIVWPKPTFLDQTTIDDLWHAAVNGRGKFVGGMDIYGGLTTVLNDIMGRIGSAAAVAVSNANISPGDSFSYASSYNTGNWSGDLQSYPIDLVTGIPSNIGKWLPSASVQLDAAVLLTGRKIATYTGTTAVPFRLANLSAAQQASLNTPGFADNATMLAFLRGDRSNEGTLYRNRGHVLGDIIDAEPVVVREPLLSYADNGYGAYKAQYTTVTPRVKTVFQAANDGMVHAFDANLGSEMWAYIPGIVLNAPLDTLNPNTSKLVNLSSKKNFTHQYYVNGTPGYGDVDFGNTKGIVGTPDWRSLLVGGFRKGGRGYYALDVTDPTALTEAAVATKVMWEFPNASTAASVKANMGYSYATPIITKTVAYGWVVIIPSGLNNGAADSGGDGMGHLFVLDAKTGTLLKDIATGVGTPLTPSGLSEISGWVDNAAIDNTVQQVYGGDLLGNVWRFDLSDKVPANWKTTLLTTLVDNVGTAQPITTPPELSFVNGKRRVYVGTGQYLSPADIPSPLGLPTAAAQVQTMYSLIDDMSVPALGAAVIAPLRSNLTAQTIIAGAATRTIKANPLGTSKGWYVDLSVTGGTIGERIITAPAISNTTIVFSTNVPSSADPCSPGGSSWLYSLNYATGAMVAGSTWAAQSLGNTLASRPILVQLPDGTVKGLVRQSNASTASTTIPTSTIPAVGKRVSWREITKG
ncbi:MAG: PilC/PilY family type IV pilus protein [Sideroxydans sp.]|nr:PilC/PilY family type IV pilus protein [Sideroxydans sp.]